MDAGTVIDLDVTGVAHGGVFVGRHHDAESAERGGRVVFVPDAIPGERVRVRLTEVGKASFWRGGAHEVLEASPHRRPHVWGAADVSVPPERRPGGADFGHIELAHQRVLKQEVLRDALQRIGGLDLPLTMAAASVVPGAQPTGPDAADGDGADAARWRTRVSLHVDGDGRIGPFAARSHRVIEVEDLPLATSAIERAALALGGGRPGRTDLVQPADGRVRVIPRPEFPRGKRPPPNPKDPAREVVSERVRGRDFHVDAGGFWQVHRDAAHTLTGVVAGQLEELRPGAAAIDPDAWHLDLYGGVGLFAATLGELGGAQTRVTSVESDPRATEHAGENLAEWVGARAETARVDRWLARLVAEASDRDRARLSRGVVVLDPPRAGAGRQVVEAVASLSPEAIVYVACDPVALARDLGTFRTLGYEAARVDGLDLFPHSHHVEAVTTLTRSGR